MGSGSSPPLGPRPHSALPSHLLNGSSPLHSSAATSNSARERESLNSSIRSSFRGAVSFESADADAENEPIGGDKLGPVSPSSLVSRPASPYTLVPPIDFDGLSWPCELIQHIICSIDICANKYFRSRH